VALAAPRVPAEPDPAAHDALAGTILTDTELIPAARRVALAPIIGRYLP